MKVIPYTVDSGVFPTPHVQGISLDREKGHLYFSFTTLLIKTDLDGRLLGSVGGLTGHLGCIKFDPVTRRLFGSLEYKNDAIGRGIRRHLGREEETVDSAFYVAIFDCDRITRPDMEAERDGVMQAAYLPEPSEDYAAEGEEGRAHRFGCSGIDGLTFGPAFGASADSPYAVTVAYGIYGENDRQDNDYQVLCRYDTASLIASARVLNQEHPHTCGGVRAEERYFVYTGNTTWGVQNLEYDPPSHTWYLAVYPGKKPEYPNRALYLIDGGEAPCLAPLRGQSDPTPRAVLSVKAVGASHESGIGGYDFPYGSTGLESLGDGCFYVSENGRCEAGQYTRLRRYRADEVSGLVPDPD